MLTQTVFDNRGLAGDYAVVQFTVGALSTKHMPPGGQVVFDRLPGADCPDDGNLISPTGLVSDLCLPTARHASTEEFEDADSGDKSEEEWLLFSC